MEMLRTDEFEKWEDFIDRNFQSRGIFFLTEVEVHGKEEKFDGEKDGDKSEDSAQFSYDKEDVRQTEEEQLKQREEKLRKLKQAVSCELERAQRNLKLASLRHNQMDIELMNAVIGELNEEMANIERTLQTVHEENMAAKKQTKSSTTAHDKAEIAGEIAPPPGETAPPPGETAPPPVETATPPGAPPGETAPAAHSKGIIGRIGSLFVQCACCCH